MAKFVKYIHPHDAGTVPIFSAIGTMTIYGTEQYFEDAATDRKSIIAPRSPGRPVTTHIEFEEACGDLLRRTREVAPQQLAATYLTVFIHTNRFLDDQRQYYGSEHQTRERGMIVVLV